MTDNIYNKQEEYYILTVTNRTYGLIDFMFDIEDYEIVSKHKWYARYDSHVKSFYLQDKDGIVFHRLIMNTPKELQVDHINRNTLDNRKCNLRNCTIKENINNRGEIHYKNKSTGIIGISKTFVSRRNKYYYHVCIPDCKNNTFATLEKAMIYLDECKNGLHRKENK